jgi:hypothetical protein
VELQPDMDKTQQLEAESFCIQQGGVAGLTCSSRDFTARVVGGGGLMQPANVLVRPSVCKMRKS